MIQNGFVAIYAMIDLQDGQPPVPIRLNVLSDRVAIRLIDREERAVKLFQDIGQDLQACGIPFEPYNFRVGREYLADTFNFFTRPDRPS
ncbi:MAG: hypothetical protein KW806_01855 [Candidatus Yanofskybacteria bacterium]|nr:hypothetical protein [Candidatus Yanofskybacteria bacterium]